MAEKKKRLFKHGQELELRITDLAFGGKGISKLQTEEGAFTIFVQNTIPGQLVKAKVSETKQRYAECKLMEVIEASPDEVSIPYQAIPGAPYATLPIELQHAHKKRTAFELFRRIGKIADPEALFDEFIASPSTWHYRNKMEYSFSAIRFDLRDREMKDDFGLGFKHRGTWWAVENMDGDSGLFDAEVENTLPLIRKWLENTGLLAWHPPRKFGLFRHLVVRKSFLTNKLLVGFVTSPEELDKFDMNGFVMFLKAQWGDRLGGVIHIINERTGDAVPTEDHAARLLFGEPKLVEELLGLQFEISLQSFFQPNPKCAEKLYEKAIQYLDAGGLGEGVLMDLFCGTGTIAQLMARESSREVIGVDIVEEAIRDAQENAKRNQIKGLRFFAADVGQFLKEFPQYRGQIAGIIVDPPRAGIMPDALEKLIELQASRIVYVSCNPATQARDAEILNNSGYDLKKFSLVDQFPHTAHLESVMWFEKIEQ